VTVWQSDLRLATSKHTLFLCGARAKAKYAVQTLVLSQEELTKEEREDSLQCSFYYITTSTPLFFLFTNTLLWTYVPKDARGTYR
jgi:hypothetical protein